MPCLDGKVRVPGKVAFTDYEVFWILQVTEAARIIIRLTTAKAQTLLVLCTKTLLSNTVHITVPSPNKGEGIIKVTIYFLKI